MILQSLILKKQSNKPTFSEAYNNLVIKKRIGKIDDAISCFKKAIQLKDNNI